MFTSSFIYVFFSSANDKEENTIKSREHVCQPFTNDWVQWNPQQKSQVLAVICQITKRFVWFFIININLACEPNIQHRQCQYILYWFYFSRLCRTGSEDIRAHERPEHDWDRWSRRPYSIFSDDIINPSHRITNPGYRYLPVHRETYGYSPRPIYEHHYASGRRLRPGMQHKILNQPLLEM